MVTSEMITYLAYVDVTLLLATVASSGNTSVVGHIDDKKVKKLQNEPFEDDFKIFD